MGFKYTAPAIYHRESMTQLGYEANLLSNDTDIKQMLEGHIEKHPEANVFFISRGQTLTNVWIIVSWKAKDLLNYRGDFPKALAEHMLGTVRRYQHPGIIRIRTRGGWMYVDVATENHKDIAETIMSTCPDHLIISALRPKFDITSKHMGKTRIIKRA